jgi:hypothetical protein
LFVSDERSAIDWLTNFAQASIHSLGNPPGVHPADRLGQAQGRDHPGAGPAAGRQLHPVRRHRRCAEPDPQLPLHQPQGSAQPRQEQPGAGGQGQGPLVRARPEQGPGLEKKREKTLLKEFETYKAFAGRKIKESRLEVLRTGFRAAWASKDYGTIISVANKLPEETLQEDEKLLTLYDLALTRTESGA